METYARESKTHKEIWAQWVNPVTWS